MTERRAGALEKGAAESVSITPEIIKALRNFCGHREPKLYHKRTHNG